MSQFDAAIIADEEEHFGNAVPSVKKIGSSDVEEDLSNMDETVADTVDDEASTSGVSSFRKRLAEAQLTDNLSEFVPETLDTIMEKTSAESKLFLDEMDSALYNLHKWKDRVSDEDDLYLVERPETDASEVSMPIPCVEINDDDVGEIRHYCCSPDMKEKLESLQQLVDNAHKFVEGGVDQAHERNYLSKNLRVDLLRIGYQAGLESMSLASAREKEILEKELEMDLHMSGLSLALEQAGHDLDSILGMVDNER